MYRQALPLLFFLASLFPGASAQPGATNYELKGRVVEMKEGKRMPVSGIKVRGGGIHYDFTDQEGSFSLLLPSNLSEITLTLEETTLKLISPSGGKVVLPCPVNFLIQVCGEENKRLVKKIDGLEKTVQDLEKKYRLSRNRCQRLAEIMTDTILYFEKDLQELSNELENKGLEIKERDEKILELENRVGQLEQQLFVAIGERFREQEKIQGEISAALRNHLTRLKDFRDWLTHFDDYFNDARGEAQNDFTKKYQAYEAAWEKINNEHENYLFKIAEYWNDSSVAAQTEATFRYILDDIHRRVYYDVFGKNVIPPLQQLYKTPGCAKCRKEAKAAAESTLFLLNEKIPVLEEMVENTQRMLSELVN